jgi:hypothetical protein
VSVLQGVPPALLALFPLSLAAGVDLYLTLFFLGVAPATSWWDGPMPGALGELHSAGVLVMVGGFYVLELAAERWPLGALFWNALHAIIRPLAGALLALLLLDGQPLEILVPGAIVAGVIASGAEAARSGGSTLLWLTGASSPHPLLVSAAEDVAVLGLVALLLDHPGWATLVSIVLIAAVLPVAGSQIRAFIFAARLALGRLWRALGRARWSDPEDFPGWVRRALSDDVMAPGGGLRGSQAAGYRLPGAPRFATGWVVVRGDDPAFVYRARRRSGLVELGRLGASTVEEGPFFRRVDLGTDGRGSARLYFGLDGPGREALRSEFLSS